MIDELFLFLSFKHRFFSYAIQLHLNFQIQQIAHMIAIKVDEKNTHLVVQLKKYISRRMQA